MKRIFILKLLATSLLIGSIPLVASPVKAKIIELGDDIRVNFSNECHYRRRTNVRVYTENGRVNVGLEEERRPQTRVLVFGRNSAPSIDISEERSAPEERVRLSLPF